MVLKFFKNISENIQKFEKFYEIKEKKDNKYLTIDCLINLLEIIELFCWEYIRNNLDKKYFDDISEKIKNQFDNIFNAKKEIQDDIFMITKGELCSAIRKLLSRYLSGKNEDCINPKNLLKSYITKYELWPSQLIDNDIENDINTIFGNLDVHISQSVKLYDHLGGDEEKLEDIKNKYKQFEEKYININLNYNKKEQNDDLEKNKNLIEMKLDVNKFNDVSENTEISELSESRYENLSQNDETNEDIEDEEKEEEEEYKKRKIVDY